MFYFINKMDNSEKVQIMNLLIGDSKSRQQKDKQDIEELFSLVFADSSSSSSSSDEFECKKPQQKYSTCLDFFETIDTYSDDEFNSHMRLKKTTVEYLISYYSQSNLNPDSTHGGRSRIGSRKTIYMYIWYMTNTVTFQQLANLFGVTRSSAWVAVQRITSFLNSISDEYVKWPKGAAAEQTKKLFEEKQGIPGVIGAIDCTHIHVKTPRANKDYYYNINGSYSLILQAVVDAQMKFIDITCGEPGSLEDSKVLRRSDLYARARKNYSHLFSNRSFILGDSAYPSKKWLVPPFKDNGNLTESQLMFNHIHSQTRRTVENTIDLLKCRFRRLEKFNEQANLSAVSKMVVSACILHNICMINNDIYTERAPAQPDDKENIPEYLYEENGEETKVDRRMILFNYLQDNNII